MPRSSNPLGGTPAVVPVASLLLAAVASTARALPIPVPGPAPIVNSVSATNITGGSALLSALVSTTDVASNVEFQYRFPGSGEIFAVNGGFVTPFSNPNFLSMELHDLRCQTPYEFRAVARNFGSSGSSAWTPFTTAACPDSVPALRLLSFGHNEAGSIIEFRGDIEGGIADNSYQWDLDGDDVPESFDPLHEYVTFPFTGTVHPKLTVTGSGGRAVDQTLDIRLAGSHFEVRANGPSTPVCGNGDGQMDPGERWRVPVRITNDGDLPAAHGYAVFADEGRLDLNPGDGTALLEIDHPLVDLGNLAAGASIDTDVEVRITDAARCDQEILLQMAAAGDEHGQSGTGNAAAQLRTASAPGCTHVTTCPATTPRAGNVTPREGFFYNPSRPGNGLSLSLVPTGNGDTTYFGLWFTGNRDRTATWYALQGPMIGNVAVTPIYKYRQDLTQTGFHIVGGRFGTAVISLISPERLLFQWRMGDRIGTEVLDYYIGGPVPPDNRTGAWFAPDEPGAGMMVQDYINARGEKHRYAIYFVYDAFGFPTWSVVDDTPAAVTEGAQALSFGSVHCPGCAFYPKFPSGPLGGGASFLRFDDATHGHYGAGLFTPAPATTFWYRQDKPILLLTKPQ